MNRTVLIVIVIGLIITNTSCQKSECIQYVQSLIEQLQKNITVLPIYSLMYSGVSTNNAGQRLECLNANYSYFLITFKNSTTLINTFTGICIESKCTKEDIEIALQSLNCKVYQFEKDPQVDIFGVIGYIFLLIWICVVVLLSVVLSCRQPDQNQFINNQKKDKSSKAYSLNQNQEEDHHSNSEAEPSKLFNYYAGYKKIFQVLPQKNIMSPILFLAVLSFSIGIECSYRQLIADNQVKAPCLLKGFLGIFITNNQIAINTIIFILGMKLAYGVYKIHKFNQIGRYLFDKILGKWLLLILMSIFIYGVMNLIDDPVRKIWSLNYGKDCPTKMWEYWFLFRNLQLDSCVCLPWLWLAETQILLTIIAVPFIIFFRVSKALTYLLMVLMVLVSLVIGVLILNSEKVFYQPERLYNNQVQFTVNYGGNSLVRASPFFLGLMFGLMILEGLQKIDEDNTSKLQNKIAKKLRRTTQLQIALQVIGIAGMVACYSSISIYLFPEDRNPYDDQSSTYAYLVMCPFFFLVSLALFLIPSFWKGRKYLSSLVNRVLGWSYWNHLERISYSYYLLAPMVIGFTTFNMQSSIYYDFDTLFTYLIGDLMIIYILSILCTAAIEYQVYTLNHWLQTKIFGESNKYSVLVIED